MWTIIKISFFLFILWSLATVLIYFTAISTFKNLSTKYQAENSAETHLLRLDVESPRSSPQLAQERHILGKRINEKYNRQLRLKHDDYRKPEELVEGVRKAHNQGFELHLPAPNAAISMIRSDADAEKFALNEQHDFNVFLSDQLPLDRNLPDVRDPKCLDKSYGGLRLTASVVICFYNEARSVLLRTVTSVLRRSPDHLLREILLVDDASSLGDLKGNLTASLSKLSRKISVLRLKEREGLIRARIAGARRAIGDTLVFMDSHCEVTDGWLEPLISEIQQNTSTVICPAIDAIHSDTLDYSASPAVRGGFNWGLHFRWESIHDSLPGSATEPYRSPAMAGGLFAINRDYFMHIGEYDEGMEIWGGENIEISLRIWMCGGSLKIAPCSRVGHIFRHRRPYGNAGKGDTQLINSVRLARVWLDEYIERFYDVRPEARNVTPKDLTSRLQLKSELQCKSFQWYLDNVYPEALSSSSNFMENSPVRYSSKFLLRHFGTGKCLDTEFLSKNGRANLTDCEKRKRPLVYVEEFSKSLVLGRKFCLDAGDVPQVSKCHFSGGSQGWIFSKDQKTTLFMNVFKGLCIGVRDLSVVFLRCNDDAELVLWSVQ